MRRTCTAVIALTFGLLAASAAPLAADQLPLTIREQLQILVENRDKHLPATDVMSSERMAQDLTLPGAVADYLFELALVEHPDRLDIGQLRNDLQLGAMSARTGSTSIVARPGISEILSAAIESGDAWRAKKQGHECQALGDGWGGRRDSNPQQQAPQAWTLPLSYDHHPNRILDFQQGSVKPWCGPSNLALTRNLNLLRPGRGVKPEPCSWNLGGHGPLARAGGRLARQKGGEACHHLACSLRPRSGQRVAARHSRVGCATQLLLHGVG